MKLMDLKKQLNAMIRLQEEYSCGIFRQQAIPKINTFDSPEYYDRNAARIEKVCNDSEGIGWGSEEMMSIYYEIEWHEEEE